MDLNSKYLYSSFISQSESIEWSSRCVLNSERNQFSKALLLPVSIGISSAILNVEGLRHDSERF